MNRISLNSSKALAAFLESQKSFEILYNTRANLNIEKVSRLLILDSSFNPPHNGHRSLVQKSLNHSLCKTSLNETNFTNISHMSIHNDTTEQDSLTEDDISVLLLLSVKNADKIVPAPATFDHRINMMCLMAHQLSTDLSVNVSVGLTNHAKFVDKAKAITRHFEGSAGNTKYPNPVKLTFVVGFDTLVRIFDPKYYVPLTVADSLEEFMSMCDIVLVTRKSEDSEDQDTKDQFLYLEKLKQGKLDFIPSHWGEKIFIVEGDNQLLKLSSSKIRKQLKILEGGDENSTSASSGLHLSEEILNYIKLHNLYIDD